MGDQAGEVFMGWCRRGIAGEGGGSVVCYGAGRSQTSGKMKIQVEISINSRLTGSLCFQAGWEPGI